MLLSRSGCSSQQDTTTTKPKKRVSFCGPITSTREDRTTDPTGTRHKTATVASGFPRSTSSQEHHRKPALSERNNKASRPHSKTAVLGTPVKTRLNCDHLRPKCQCSTLATKKKGVRTRHKVGIVSGPRRTLISTCLLPRGEVDGRKTYKEKGDSVSMLDNRWQPELDSHSRGKKDERNSGHELSSDVNKENNIVNIGSNINSNTKKTVKFADRVHKEMPSTNTNMRAPIGIQGSRESRQDHSHHSSRQHKAEHQSHPHSEGAGQHSHSHSSTHPPEPRTSWEQSSSSQRERQEQESQSDYCKLCELAKIDYPAEHLYDRKTSQSYDYKDKADPSALHTNIPKSTGLSSEQCLLCRRYGNKHYYIDDSYRCELCERIYPPYSSSGLNDNSSTYSKSRAPIQRQNSAPGLLSPSAKEDVGPRTIPYEPRTDLVKDLKKKLEAEYKSSDQQLKRKGAERGWRSWDAEDVGKLSSARHRRHLAWDPSLCHKCVHRYQQNDRLFLEPTLTDSVGRSVCGECGAPQPSHPDPDPYLYHITLGGLREDDDSNPRGRATKNHPLKAKNIYMNNDSQPRKAVGDTSKHIYAKLNSNVNNILPPGQSGYSLRPQSASSSRSRVSIPHPKRPPAKSMALVDHLV